MNQINITPEILSLIARGALFFISHSGGKDSQAMYAELLKHIPFHQIVVIHAHLGEVEWSGVQDHIRDNISHELNVITANWADGSEKSFLGMVEKRFEDRPSAPSWPSTSMRFCTSDLKRDPIHKFIRRICKARGVNLAVNCTGMRAEESSARAKLAAFEICKRLTNKSREVFEWRPIHDWTTQEVFAGIEAAGQNAFWAYEGGNERLSCMFCIMGSDNDLRHAARVNPELANKYIALEHRTGYSMFHKKTLESIIASDLT